MNLLHLLSRYRIHLLTGLCCASIASAALSSGLISSKQARSADSFVDSVGVAVHLGYTDTTYGKYDEIVKPRLRELGVRHIRDGVRLEDIDIQQKFLDLAKIGIKSTLVMDPRELNHGSLAVNVVKSIPESVEAVEGPNEWEIQPELKYAGQSFPQAVRRFQAELYSAIKADPVTATLPVLSPSILAPHLAFVLGRVPCDVFNIHNYPRGLWGMPMDEMKWGSPVDELNNRLNLNSIICGNKPVIITETGYNTSMKNHNENGVSEQVAAKYLLRMFLAYFNQKIKRFYAYELTDLNSDPQGEKWGLLRYDGSPKPSFIALKNLISLLQDPQTITYNSFPLDSLDYNLQGNKNNIRHTLLQKSNGTFYLILWQEVPSFEHKTKTDITVAERPLNLILNTPISQVTIYQPVNSTAPVNQYKNAQQLELKVPDHPLIIELVPA